MRAFALVTLALAATSCTLNTDYFSEYRGKNLLSNYGFDDGTNAKWALEEPDGSMTSSASITSANFMNWVAASTDTTLAPADQLGPDGTSPSYRLEIKNLVPDGDFQAENSGQTSLGTNWTKTGGAVDFNTTFSVSGNSETMTDQALRWTAASQTDTLNLDLKAAVGTWPAYSTYRFRADYMNLQNDSVYFKFVVAGTTADWSPSGTATTYLTLWSLSKEFQVTSGDASSSRSFQVSDGLHQPDILLDNVKLVPDINTLWVKTSLPLLSSGSATLLPGSKAGMYVFTVQVKDDPTVGPINGLNRFNPSAVTVRLVANVKSGTGSSVTVFQRPVGGWPTWTTLTVNTGFDFVTENSASKAALTVEISPTDMQTAAGVDAGSVLVAQPSLTFNP